MDYINVLAYAKEQAEQEGRRKGRQEGIKTNQLETVINAHNLGLSPQEISQITGLSEQTINAMIETKS